MKVGRIIPLAVTLAGILFFAAYWLGGKSLFSASPVRIGVLHSLTGTMAESEAPLVDAVRLAVEEANRSGGIAGAPIEMRVADCRSDAAYCAGQAERLITQDGVQVLFGCWTSACRKAVRQVVEKYHHLLFYPVQYEGLEQSPDIIYTGAAPNQQLVPMLTWAMQRYGRRVYFIGSDYVFPRTANRIARKLLQAHGGQVVRERYIALGERKLEDIARDIAQRRPDFVLNTINGDSNRYFFRALAQAGVRAEEIPVFSTSLTETEVAAIGADLVRGHYAAWNYFQSVPGEANRAFVEAFQRRYGRERPVGDPVEAAYISVKLWVHAMREVPHADLATLKTVLMHESFVAPEGAVAVDAGTHHLWKPVRIGRARPDGQFEIVWESERSIAPSPFPFFLFSETSLMQGKRQ